ncbi:MAG: nucleotide pyrophosphohydrolase [Planctomycetota bacterium]|nr:nucleotide pyrophosphohydrolase [Planctomycetota bacterium]
MPDTDPNITNDQQTRVQSLRDMVEAFVSERDWHQFHSPKNLSMALSVEAAELMENLQWISLEESRQPDEEKLQNLTEELADVLCYALALANALNIDVASAMKTKMVKNRKKYPVQQYKGYYGKDDAKLKSKDGHP